MEALHSELASLVRVRNRLAHSSDASLPKILTGLLPRLAEHLDRHASALEGLRRRQRQHQGHAAQQQIDEELALRTKLQGHVSGIWMHALERIRGGVRTMSPGAPWIMPLLHQLEQQQQKESSERWTDVTVAFVLSLLQASLPHLRAPSAESLSTAEDPVETSKARARQQMKYLSILSALGSVVDRLHRSVVEDASQSSNTIRRGPNRGESSPASSRELNYRSTSWLCLDVLAMSWGLPLLVDWDRDHFDEYDWKTPAPFSLHECATLAANNDDSSTITSLDPDPKGGSIAIPWLESPGMFHLALDLLLFWPSDPNHEPFHRILHQAEHVVADHDAGISPVGVDLLNSRRDRGGRGAGQFARASSKQCLWNVRYLRELKYSCVNQVGEVLRSQGAAAASDPLAVARALLICILGASPGSMHGKLALRMLNKSHMYWGCCHEPTSLNDENGKKTKKRSPALAGGRLFAEDAAEITSAPPCPYDLTFASCLLVLVLGDRVASPILDGHAVERTNIEALLGPNLVLEEHEDRNPMEQAAPAMAAQDQEAEPADTMEVEQNNNVEIDLAPRPDDEIVPPRRARRRRGIGADRHEVARQPQHRHMENQNQAQFRFQRAPMPFGVAERVVEFISTQLLPKDLPDGFVDLSNTSNGHIIMTAENWEERESLGLFVKLALSLKDQKGKVGAYWALQIFNGIYRQLPPSTAAAFPGEWMDSFYQSSLNISSAVLSHIAQVEAEGQQLLGEIEQQQDQGQGRRALGVPGPFGGRRDLNKLLADHRVSQRKRQLRVDCALEARKMAYGIITDLASQIVAPCQRQLESCTNGAETKSLTSDLFDFEIPIILLKCAVGEEDVGMYPFVTKALDALLEAFKHCLKTNPTVLSESQVAPLLPSLLCAVCADSNAARLGAAKWAVYFVEQIDPPASLHICTFLAEDRDPVVSAAAKKGFKALAENTNVVVEDVSTSATMEVSMENIKTDLDQKVTELALAVDLPPSAARVVLGDYGFDVAKAQNEMKNNRSKVIVNCGVASRCDPNSSSREDQRLDEERLCEICYDEVGMGSLFAMPCEHKFCRSCWQEYLENDLQTWSRGPPTKECPEQTCWERVTKEDVAAVAPGLISQWQDIELRSFVDGDCCYSKCPGPDCNVVVRSKKSLGTASACCSTCNNTFCFSCGSPPHQPAYCDDFAKWRMIYEDSDLWIKKNAKPCPGCNIPIEKNDGCNHMHCSHCNFDFCWLCLGPLGNDHFEPHICNRYKPQDGAENERQRRALFFSGRYEAHESAAFYAKTKATSFVEKREKLAAESLWFLSDDDLDLSEKAANTLVEARNFLKNSYVTAWAMRDDLDIRESFESYQANLELFTEKLSWLLLMTKLHNLHLEGGGHAIHMHFRAVSFSSASIVKYMGRIRSLLKEPS